MPPDESKGSQLDAIGSLAQRQLDNTPGAVQPTGRYRLCFWTRRGPSSETSRHASLEFVCVFGHDAVILSFSSRVRHI